MEQRVLSRTEVLGKMLSLRKSLLPWSFAGAGALIFVGITLLHFWSVYNQLRKHVYLDASQTLSFVEMRFLAYKETLSLLKHPPEYLKNPAWLIDEFQSQPFLYGVLIWRGKHIILNSFPQAKKLPEKFLLYSKRGFEAKGLFYLSNKIETKTGEPINVLVAIDTSFQTKLWHRTLLHGLLILLTGIGAMVFLGYVLARMLKRERQMMLMLADAEKLASAGRLSAMLAHEIRNPLNTLSMGLQYLKEVSEPRAELLEKMQREVERLNGLINEFLQIARGIEIKSREIWASEILQEIEKEVSSLVEAKDVDFEVVLDKDFSFKGDPLWLIRALSNIVLNAGEAIKAKGWIKLKAWEEEKREEIVFEVEDNGPGISKEDLVNIKRPFYSTKKQGFGIGLYLAERVAKAHGGRLIVENRGSGGCQVKLIIKKQGSAWANE